MKLKKHILTITLLIVLFTTSCTTEKKAYLSNYHVGWKNSTHNLNKPNLVKNDVEKKNQEDKIVPENQSISQSSEMEDENEKSELIINSENDNIFENEAFPPSSNVNNSTPEDSIKEYDILVLKSGTEIKVKVLEILDNEIKVKRFSDLDGDTITIKKSKVKLIRYGNGIVDDYKIAPKTLIDSTTIDTTNTKNDTSLTKESTTNNEISIHPLAMVGFVLSAFTILLVFAAIALTLTLEAPFIGSLGIIVFGITGEILSMVGDSEIKKNPKKWKGKGFAIAGIIIPFFTIILALLIAIWTIFYLALMII